MSESQQTTNTPPREIDLGWADAEERQSLKMMLLGIKKADLTQAEKQVLQTITREEQDEERTAAAIARLTDDADKWGRKQLTAATRAITDEVAKFSKAEKDLLSEALVLANKHAQSIKALAKIEMDKIQRKLQNDLEKAKQEQADAVDMIRNKFRPEYAGCELKLRDATTNVTNTVGTYAAYLQTLKFKELEVLLRGETLTLGTGSVAPLKA